MEERSLKKQVEIGSNPLIKYKSLKEYQTPKIDTRLTNFAFR